MLFTANGGNELMLFSGCENGFLSTGIYAGQSKAPDKIQFDSYTGFGVRRRIPDTLKVRTEYSIWALVQTDF